MVRDGLRSGNWAVIHAIRVLLMGSKRTAMEVVALLLVHWVVVMWFSLVIAAVCLRCRRVCKGGGVPVVYIDTQTRERTFFNTITPQAETNKKPRDGGLVES